MNQEQRKKLQGALDILTEIQEQEQEKYDNAPEGLQDTDRMNKFQEDADELQEAIDIIQSILEGGN
jgi:soluble cytochrome b562